MRYFNLIFIGLVSCVSYGQESTDNLQLYDHFQELTAANVYESPDYYNWGASIIKDRQMYHLFYSRWQKSLGFTGWLTNSEIAHATSKSPSGPWKFKETVLQGSNKKERWDAITAHNPKIKYFDGNYYLYYIGTTADTNLSSEELAAIAKVGYTHPKWKILRENQRTGVAVSNSINGPWKRMDNPIIEPSGPITTLTVNPAIEKAPDGTFYLIVKGDKPNEKRFIRNQAVAISASPVGPFEMQEKPVIDYMDTEDMSIWFDKTRNRFYGVFHAHDFIGLVTSVDGLTWKKSDEYVLTTKQLKFKDGTVIHPDRMERPFIYHENGIPKVLSLAIKTNNSSYTVTIPIHKTSKPRPNKRQLAWQEAELGVIFHYDLHVFDGKKYGQSGNRIDPVDNHQIFNPTALDTDQWVKAAKDAGATFALLTATHETGFALYPSKVNPYNVSTLTWKNGQGDVVADFIASCHKYGIKPGIYLGIRWNSFIGVSDFEINGEGEFKENRQRWYAKMIEGMVEEISKNYGELFEIWFDGGADHPDNGAPDVLPIIRKYQPNCLFYHNGQLAEARWGGSESGTVAYPNWATFPYKATGSGESAKKNIATNNFQLLKEGDPNGNYWMPAMADAPLRGYNGRHEWFWEPGDEAHIFPVENLVNMYYKSVGRNATLILGLTPDPTGLLPQPDVDRLAEFGRDISSRFKSPLGIYKSTGKTHTVHFNTPTSINHVIIQEDIQYGENIRDYQVQGLKDGKWIILTEGKSIGHKRIEKFSTETVKRIRLKVRLADGKVRIKHLSAYFVAKQ